MFFFLVAQQLQKVGLGLFSEVEIKESKIHLWKETAIPSSKTKGENHVLAVI